MLIKRVNSNELIRLIDKRFSYTQVTKFLKPKAQKVGLLFPDPIIGHGFIQWPLPPGDWAPYTQGKSHEKDIVETTLTKRLYLLRQLLEFSPVCDKWLVIPDDSFIFFKMDASNKVDIAITGWGHKFHGRPPGGEFIGKALVEIHVTSSGVPMANKACKVTFNNDTFTASTNHEGKATVKIPLPYDYKGHLILPLPPCEVECDNVRKQNTPSMEEDSLVFQLSLKEGEIKQPEPKPEPKPIAIPKPEPKPIAIPKPEPKPIATPKPEPKPTFKPKPKPEPEPMIKPKLEPAPIPKPKPVPKREPEPMPKLKPVPKPEPEPMPKPKPVPKPEPPAKEEIKTGVGGDPGIEINVFTPKEKDIVNSLPIGTVLKGKAYSYTIKKALGQGSFGITYFATVQLSGDLGTIDGNASVAIKEFFMRGINGRADATVTYGSKGGIYDDYKRKFIREAKNLSQLKHPNIIGVIEEFEANNTEYYAMEYIKSGSLDDYIERKGYLNEKEAVKIAMQIGKALSFMHDKHMLHLDIKPGNVMMRENGDAVLIDFGLSKQYDDSGKPDSSAQVGAGTPGYAPIEQANYQEGNGFPVTMDVYALGGTLFKMLTGMRAPEAVAIYNDGFPEDELKEKGVSKALTACIKKAMSPKKKDRYQTVKELLDALSRL